MIAREHRLRLKVSGPELYNVRDASPIYRWEWLCQKFQWLAWRSKKNGVTAPITVYCETVEGYDQWLIVAVAYQ